MIEQVRLSKRQIWSSKKFEVFANVMLQIYSINVASSSANFDLLIISDSLLTSK